jgi:hypothetical protein
MMNELARKIAALHDELTPAWDEEHTARLLEGIGHLQRRRRSHLTLVAIGALGAVCVLAALLGRHNLAAIGDVGAFLIRMGGGAMPDPPPPQASQLTAAEHESAVANDPAALLSLGRVLLENLGQPSEAAEAFALARGCAPHGPLAEDALAREVEALSKAGHSREAYERAQLYVQSYPSGRRLHAVRLFGGLAWQPATDDDDGL